MICAKPLSFFAGAASDNPFSEDEVRPEVVLLCVDLDEPHRFLPALLDCNGRGHRAAGRGSGEPVTGNPVSHIEP